MPAPNRTHNRHPNPTSQVEVVHGNLCGNAFGDIIQAGDVFADASGKWELFNQKEIGKPISGADTRVIVRPAGRTDPRG